MAQLQHRGRGAVVLPAAEPLAQPHPVLVPHGGGRLVAHPPAGRGQPPDEVDVLPDPHGLGETGPRPRPAGPPGPRQARKGRATPAGRCSPAHPCPGWNWPPRTAPARCARAHPGRCAARPRPPPGPRSAAAARPASPGRARSPSRGTRPAACPPRPGRCSGLPRARRSRRGAGRALPRRTRPALSRPDRLSRHRPRSPAASGPARPGSGPVRPAGRGPGSPP